MARISVSELYELMQAGAKPVIIDVRSPSARTLEPHWIPGALHISLPDVAPHLKDLPRDRDIILYCTCPNEASAARVAKILMNHGFKRVRPLARRARSLAGRRLSGDHRGGRRPGDGVRGRPLIRSVRCSGNRRGDYTKLKVLGLKAARLGSTVASAVASAPNQAASVAAY